jgi:hypothetical protein
MLAVTDLIPLITVAMVVHSHSPLSSVDSHHSSLKPVPHCVLAVNPLLTSVNGDY